MATFLARPPIGERTRSKSSTKTHHTADGQIVFPGTSGTEPPPPTKMRSRKSFVLCFDGTGNKFSGTDADSNILKIYRMLDRDDDCQFHYYQPGIGTYVQSSSLSHSSKYERLKSWYLKSKDSAIGSSFDEHVMGGYRFLMRYYSVGDDIYLFGFSRGAYTARFLAEMLDHVGLLSAGNEEMARFAWKAFQSWQTRTEDNDKQKAQKRYLINYLKAFRETFSRPVRRIRFLGLFDTVNSVPQFENAWMQRSKFPYTARSTSKVIRHAVAIDERRAKFRQDLIGEMRPAREHHYRRRPHWWEGDAKAENEVTDKTQEARGRRLSEVAPDEYHDTLEVPQRFRDPSETSGVRSLSPNINPNDPDQRSICTSASQDSMNILEKDRIFSGNESDEEEQDIKEVWFPGCHADIGGGWPLSPGEDTALAHIPLVWMVREAERAGLKFDPVKVRDLNCCEDVYETRRNVPQIAIDLPQPDVDSSTARSDLPSSKGTNPESMTALTHGGPPPESQHQEAVIATRFQRALDFAAKSGCMHDVLQFGQGASSAGVIAWNFMEYLPFRRMDLQPDGSWKSINWPLPKGEVRDISDNVVVHHSVIKRMKADPTYRPGNLIVGGGGRGVRRAPEKYGMGRWKVLREEGDPIGEVWVRDPEAKDNGNGVEGRE